LVHDLLCRDAAKMYFDVLKKRVGDFKQTEEGRRIMCKAMEKIKAEGKRETMLATAKRLLANGKLVLKEIAQCTGLSLAQVKKLQASMA
jgi:predicted transposase YdaD